MHKDSEALKKISEFKKEIEPEEKRGKCQEVMESYAQQFVSWRPSESVVYFQTKTKCLATKETVPVRAKTGSRSKSHEASI